MKQKNNSFLGQGWAFPIKFNKEFGSVELAFDEEDIRQSIRIILGTIPGERALFPKFGCNIREYVFESNDVTHITILKDIIYDALLFFEPRIKVKKIDILDNPNNQGVVDAHLNGRVDIHVEYTVIITNTRSNLVYPFHLTEGTNVGSY